jgi:hypothetical protein
MYCLYNTYSVNILKSFVRCVSVGEGGRRKGFLHTIQRVSSQAKHCNTKAKVRNSQYLINNSRNKRKTQLKKVQTFAMFLKNMARNMDQWRDFIHTLITSLILLRLENF